MADNRSTDIVDLRIDAENLAIDEINETIEGLSELGKSARDTEKDLKKLEITQDTIKSFERIQTEVKQLRDQVDAAELSYEKMNKAQKESKNVTDEEVLALKAAKRELSDLRVELRGQETEYRKVAKTLKSYGVDVKDLGTAQQRLQDEIKETSAASERLNQEYQEQAAAIRQRIAVEKEAAAVTAAANAAEEEKRQQLAATTAEQEKQLAQAKRIAEAEAEQARKQEELAAKLRIYENQIREMNDELERSTLVKADYIRQEERLRQTLQLTEGQTRAIRASLAAEISERKAAENAMEQQRLEQEKLANAQKQAVAAAQAAATAERQAAAELSRVESAVKEYEVELAKLNEEKRDGVLSTGDYIRKEAELRSALRLTETQVRTTRRAVEADAVSKKTAAKNTDLLTQATRRLAQVYTVLLASQKSIEAVSQSVQEYGKLEAAITKVEKTTGIARAQVEAMADELNTLAQEITPTATTELLRYAEVAGQLGTKSAADILNLAVAADALELSTNLAGDEAVELLARILTMTGEGIPAIQNLSSVMVGLGNDFAASEAEIAQLTKEIVTGTREINLSSAAAAAFGATLAELGQPAERSRTAIQRLSGAIKEASLNGGRDLERLSQITEMTAEQIVTSLGTEPEKVLVAFLEGLDRVNESGGQMSKVLNSIGIDGTEALSVLGILAGGTERLKDALALANAEFIAGDGHIKEAIKSYANQESALGRLSNQFAGLRKQIGEAFSPDVDAAIRTTGNVIEDTTEQVVSIMELLPELVVGLGEALDALTDITSGLISDDSGLGALDILVNGLKLSFNGLTGVLKIIQIGMREVAISAMEATNALREMLGLEVSTVGIDRLKKSISELQQEIDRDVNDINNAWARLNGESSIAYEKFIESTRQYGTAVSRLNDEQRALIASIIERNKYSADEESTYRALTAAIIRANREVEIEAATKQNLAKINADAAAAKQAETAATQQSTETQAQANLALDEYLVRVENLKTAIDDIAAKRQQGILTDTEAAEATGILVGVLGRYNEQIAQQSDQLGVNSASLEDNRLARIQLFEAYQAGAITEAEFIAQMQAIIDRSKVATIETESFASSVNLTSETLADYSNRILDSQRKIEDYKNELRSAGIVEAEALKIKAQLAVEEQKLIRLKAEQAKFAQIENANYQQLTVLQRKYQQELDAINRAFERGALSKAEYEKRLQLVKIALQEITNVLGENTAVTDENTAATDRNADAQSQRAESIRQVTSAMSLELSAASHLNKQYDFSNSSVDTLNGRLRELQSNIVQNSRVSSVWWRQLALTSNEVFKQERAAINAEIAQRKLSGQIQQTTFAELLLAKRTREATQAVNDLGNTGLDPLLKDIETAKRELQSLTATVQDTLDDVQDRLDRVLGNEQEIVKRRFQRELDELLELQDRAKAAGDMSLVKKVQEALRKLQEAQSLEYEQQFDQKLSAPTRRTSRTTTTPTLPTGQDGGATVTTQPAGAEPKAVLVLQVGDTQYQAQMSASSLDKLVSDINRSKRLT